MYLLNNFYILNPGEEEFEFFKGSLLVNNGRIEKIVNFREQHQLPIDDSHIEVIDGEFKKLIFPGFIQTHLHLCQTLHRNLAEEMPLIQWLKDEIWPYEASLDRKKMGKSVMMSLKEILSSGTTSILDMGTVRHQQLIFEIMEEVGYRYTGGKAMMDKANDIPSGLRETKEDSIKESLRLVDQFHGGNNGLLNYAFAPRFLLSCSDELLHEVKNISDEKNILIQTHGAEHPEEVSLIRAKTGFGNIAYLEKIGALNCFTVIAHMVHLDDSEKQIVKDYDICVVHCPNTNLKLGSGVAPIAQYMKSNILVGLGSDGAPCNNSLSVFDEMKLASLLQKGTNNNPLSMPAEDALRLVSINGSKIIRQEDRVGKISEGMDADLVILDMDTPQTYNFEKNPCAAIVFGADERNVFGAMVRGKFLFLDNHFSDEIEELSLYYE
jgi:5-methylthioadenosine/S-adenosylhomocysteine deaminase